MNRDDLEKQFSARIAKALRSIKGYLLGVLGAGMNKDALTPDVWNEVSKQYTQAVVPALETVFVSAVTTTMESGAALAWDGVNERAANWAAQYGFDLVKGITDNDAKYLQTSLNAFYREQLTLGDLTDRIARQYSPVRAEMIAVTETTRAAVEGDRYYAQELAKMGVRMRGIVETNRDERVCAVCGPNQGQDVAVVGYPPFHVRCRCNVRYVNEV